tara:strand:+ start:32 stop:823 length:792 start_codon:yes stop_codon:yes gene_type:complete
MNIYNLKNKNIIITGAFGLIGSELSKVLLKNNNKLVLIDLNIDKKSKNYNYFKKKRASIFDIDLKDKKNLEQFFKQNKSSLKKINTLVNLASVDRKIGDNDLFEVGFHEYSNKLIKEMVENNLIGNVNICQEICKLFIEEKIKNGNIINVASTYSLVAPNENFYDGKKNKPIDYVVSKGSIPILTKYIATTYGKYGIRCNYLVPHGVIKKPGKKILKKFKKFSPIGRPCKINEIIDPIIFLISDSSKYMTGSSLVVDGGWTAW